MFDVESLRRIINNLDYKKSVKGGDNFASHVSTQYTSCFNDVIKAFKGKDVSDESSVCSVNLMFTAVTKQGMASPYPPQMTEASFSEYTWDEVMEDMVEMHSIPVLGKNDVD